MLINAFIEVLFMHTNLNLFSKVEFLQDQLYITNIGSKKNKQRPLLGHTINEYTHFIHIRDIQTFKQSIQKFSKLEELFIVYIDYYEIQMND